MELVKRDARIEVAHAQREMDQSQVRHSCSPHLRRSGPATLKWLARRATATTSLRGKIKSQHRAGLGAGSSRIRQLEQCLAVTGLGRAPASEILAAQFRQ